MENMKKHCWQQPTASLFESEEVNSTEWEFIEMTEQEEDLILRMHRLIGDRLATLINHYYYNKLHLLCSLHDLLCSWWDLIAGRIPGRKAEEIERFWIMRNSEWFAQIRKENKTEKSKIFYH